jgi:hypothetical protein
MGAILEQIASYLNPYAIPIGRVNLLYLFDVERIHVIDLSRSAVQIKHDPLLSIMTEDCIHPQANRALLQNPRGACGPNPGTAQG